MFPQYWRAGSALDDANARTGGKISRHGDAPLQGMSHERYPGADCILDRVTP